MDDFEMTYERVNHPFSHKIKKYQEDNPTKIVKRLQKELPQFRHIVKDHFKTLDQLDKVFSLGVFL